MPSERHITPPDKGRYEDLLWVCHCCEMIGSDAEAERHIELTGHRIERLDRQTTDAIRDLWMTK